MAYKLRKALLSHVESIKPIAIKFFTKDPDMKLEVGRLRGPQSLRAKKKEPSCTGSGCTHGMCHMGSVITMAIIISMYETDQ